MSEETLEQEGVQESQETVQEQQVEVSEEQATPAEDQFNVLDSIYRDLGVAVDEQEQEAEPEPEPAPEPEPEPETQEETVTETQPEPEAVDEEPPASDPSSKKVYYRKPQAEPDDVRKTIQEELAKQQQTPQYTPPQAEQEVEAEDPYDGFLPEQVAELELAAFAEKADSKYKGMSKRLRDFYSKLDNYIETESKEDPDRAFDENDEEFRQFVINNKPTFDPGDQRRLERQQIKEEAVAEASQKFEEQQTEMQKKLRRLEIEPKIDKSLDQFDATMNSSLGEDMSDPFNKELYSSHLKAAKDVGREYMKLYHGIDQYDQNNGVHSWLVEFVTEQAGLFSKHGGKALDREGKTFLTPAEYGQIGNPQKHWTFTPDDVLNIIGTRYIESAKEQGKKELSRLEKLGFTRQQAEQSSPQANIPVQTEEDTQPVTPVKTKTNASPGAAVPTNSDEPTYGQALVNLLGIDD